MPFHALGGMQQRSVQREGESLLTSAPTRAANPDEIAARGAMFDKFPTGFRRVHGGNYSTGLERDGPEPHGRRENKRQQMNDDDSRRQQTTKVFLKKI
jgi:hypothetical protein